MASYITHKYIFQKEVNARIFTAGGRVNAGPYLIATFTCSPPWAGSSSRFQALIKGRRKKTKKKKKEEVVQE